MKISQEKQDRIRLVADKIQNNKYLSSVSNGLMGTLPLLMIGAVSTLLSSIPAAGYQAFITKTGLKPLLALPADFTINLIALFAVFIIAYKLAESFEYDALMAGVISLVSFFILTPTKTVEKVKYISYDWLGAKGLFVAMLVGVFSTILYMKIVEKKITIKMPKSVPPTVTKTFAAIIPGMIIVTVFTAIKALAELTGLGSIHDIIYNFLQLPLQHVGGSYFGLVIFILVSEVLWLFGVHGTMVTNVVAKPLLLSMDVANLAAYQAGQPMPFIISWSFRFVYVLIGGSGCTMGLNLLMMFKAKSEQLKAIGKVAFPTSCFSINEPIIFGIPIVLNPIFALPFIITPVITMTIGYVLTVMKIVPTPIGVFLPTGTPLIIAAFIEGGIKVAILQVLLIGVSALCYYPFFKKYDDMKYKEELAQAEVAATELN